MEPERDRPAASGRVQIVDQTLLVLKEIAMADRPRGVRELSRDLEISKSSTQRILSSLEHAGLVVLEEESRKYAIGPAALTLAWRYGANSDLVGAASGVATSLAARTGETVSVSTVVDGQRVTVYEAESPQQLRLITGVGRPYSLFVGATSRVLLALQSDEEIERLAARADRVPEGAPPGRADLARRVAETRAEGYAVSREEWIPGGGGVAVPIGVQNGMAAALSIYAPEVRLPEERLDDLIGTLQEGARQIAVRWRS